MWFKLYQDRFTTCFKTCGTGPLILGVGGGFESTLVPEDRQKYRTGKSLERLETPFVK